MQIANSAVNGLTCSANVTINPTTGALNVGTLPANYVTIGALGTATSWMFDTTSPATALASLGGGSVAAATANQLAFYPGAGTSIAGTSAIPGATTATTQSPSDNSTRLATTAYVAAPGIINPTSVQVAAGTAMTGNQGTGALVQHATGAAVAGNYPIYDATGNLIDSGGSGLGGTLSNVNIVLASAAGMGATSTVTGLDGNHHVEITTGSSGTGSGLFWTMTFTASRGHNAYCIIQDSIGSTVIRSSSASATSYTATVPSSLTTSLTYEFNVSCP